MSGVDGILLALLTLGSCYASYRLGQQSVETKYRQREERRRRWEEWEEEGE